MLSLIHLRYPFLRFSLSNGVDLVKSVLLSRPIHSCRIHYRFYSLAFLLSYFSDVLLYISLRYFLLFNDFTRSFEKSSKALCVLELFIFGLGQDALQTLVTNAIDLVRNLNKGQILTVYHVRVCDGVDASFERLVGIKPSGTCFLV